MALVSNILTQVFITLIAVAGVYVLTGLTGCLLYTSDAADEL